MPVKSCNLVQCIKKVRLVQVSQLSQIHYNFILNEELGATSLIWSLKKQIVEKKEQNDIKVLMNPKYTSSSFQLIY